MFLELFKEFIPDKLFLDYFFFGGEGMEEGGGLHFNSFCMLTRWVHLKNYHSNRKQILEIFVCVNKGIS